MHLVEPSNTLSRTRRRKSLTGQVVLVLMGLLLMFFTAFTGLSLPTPTVENLTCVAENYAKSVYDAMPPRPQSMVKDIYPSIDEPVKTVTDSPYSLYGPIAVFLGYVLGPALATISTALFLAMGIVGPFVGIYPLATGGGTSYYLEPGAGYLIGTVACAFVAGKLTCQKRTSLSQGSAVVIGLSTLHAVGVAYLFGTYLFFYIVEGSKTFLEWQPWIFQYIRNLTWYSLFYDVVFSTLLVGLAFPVRWLVKTLTQRDSGQRTGRAPYNRKVLSELGVNQ